MIYIWWIVSTNHKRLSALLLYYQRRLWSLMWVVLGQFMRSCSRRIDKIVLLLSYKVRLRGCRVRSGGYKLVPLWARWLQSYLTLFLLLLSQSFTFLREGVKLKIEFLIGKRPDSWVDFVFSEVFYMWGKIVGKDSYPIVERIKSVQYE